MAKEHALHLKITMLSIYMNSDNSSTEKLLCPQLQFLCVIAKFKLQISKRPLSNLFLNHSVLKTRYLLALGNLESIFLTSS